VQKYTKNSIYQSLTFCQHAHLFVSNAEKQGIKTKNRRKGAETFAAVSCVFPLRAGGKIS
jgi:hypothetical protein